MQAAPNSYQIKIFSGNANRPLAESVSSEMGIPLGDMIVSQFVDSECNVKILETVRGRDVYIIQPTVRSQEHSTNHHIMELLVMLDTFKRASAGRITAIIPYFGYCRSDRKTEPRVPISARLMADLLKAAGASRVATVDLHSRQIQGFFDVPTDNILSCPTLYNAIKDLLVPLRPIVASPDKGGVQRALKMAKKFNTEIAMVDKRRPAPNVAAVANVVGDVRGRVVLIIDDIIDTAGTLCEAAKAFVRFGATRVYAAAAHGLFSGPAYERIRACDELERIWVTDTVLPLENEPEKITRVPIGPLLAAAINKLHTEQSISVLFE
eukprot:gnl/Trimastix_PCT/1072.p1 GENE.gnl/Trimastix_PCT/1072~~gnl/Trimastix_PCT/1072.p1  ORF type:complete len:323 (+),score=106.21 gnl/Trimastix_PCT/1072:95-1063(+)